MQAAQEISFAEKDIADVALDHQVDVNPLTGAAVVSVSLPLTPGRSGFGPSLALQYSSSVGNSVFGVGWSLSGLPSIGLSSKRLPKYECDDPFVFNGSNELVPMLEEDSWEPIIYDEDSDYRIYYYRSKVEQDYTRFEKWVHRETGRIHWRARSPDNSIAIFGYDESDVSRIQDPENPSKTYQWLIETQYDDNGNAICYEYWPENWDNVDISNSYERQRLISGKGFTQRYLKRILYGNTHPLSAATPTADANRWLFQIVFDYGEHSDAPWPSHQPSDGYQWPARSDPFSTHRPGFEVRTHRLCRRVLMFHHFDQLGQHPAPVGAVILKHSEDPAGRHPEDPAGTTLEEIGYTGYRTDIQTREITSQSIPPLSFTYSQPDMGRHFQPISETAALNLPQGLSGLNYLWMDLYGEGLPGILTETNQAWYYKPNMGWGQFGHQTLVAQKPSNLVGSYALSDFDSDGNPNLVMFAGRQAGYCEYDRDQDQWQGYRPFPCAPVLEEMGTSAQWIDLNGDGRSDIIISKQDRFTWYPSEGKEGFGAPVEFANPGIENAAQAPAIEEDLRLNYLFADMSGDGLLDRVRIRNGRVEYWPQLGNGRFGDAITMENAPSFDFENQFDLGRLRLADLDGSGTADLIYLGRGEFTYWINAGGNCFLEGVRISGLPYIDNLSSSQVLDFLGDGTPCLVWSSPLNSQAHAPLQYLPLTNGIQPRLLLSVDNAMGKRVDLTYSNSSWHYLRDNLSGRPWISKLPNHATVVDRMDVWDQIGNTRFCSRYEYHDGFFDNGEREFRGFSQVDRYDSENFDPSADMAEDRFTDPACIRTFYHNGAFGWDERRRQYYYQGDPVHALLPEPAFHEQLDFFGQTFEDGFRALAGRMLRQEIFTVDRAGKRAEHPFQVTQNTYRIRQLQPVRDEDDACFDVYLSETLVYEYEQDPDDPRVTHDLTLDVDPYGNVKRTCAIAYPRREGIADALEDQRRSYLSVSINEFTDFNEISRLETAIPVESKAYELAWPESETDSLLDYETVVQGVSDALENPLGVDETLPRQPETPQVRLIQWQRFFYWDADTTTALSHGDVGPQTLLHHQETACFNDGLIQNAFRNDAGIDIQVDTAMLETQGRYRFQEGYWWQPDSTLHYGNADTFFSLNRVVRLDGGTTQYEYDYDDYLTLASVTDARGNRTQATIDYNLVAPWQITDPNQTVAEAHYDPLGMIVVATTQGTVVGLSGTSAPYGHDRLTAYTPPLADETDTAAIIANPGRFVQNAGQFLHYNLAVTPPVSISLVREQWVHDGSGSPSDDSPIQVQLTYLDGFGRTLQNKQRVEEGPAIQRNNAGDVMLDTQGRPLEVDSTERWRVSGHTVYNNKQLPVRQYEPFFSTLTRFEGDEDLQTYGVSTLSRYDALGRLVETELPNGTLTRVETTPWKIRNFDPNDTVEGSPYAVLHELLPDSDPERQAYDRALAHDSTPLIIRRDPLGRDIEQEETSREHPHRITRTRLDIQGNTIEIIDPRGLSAFAYQHDMLGRVLHEYSMDAGDKWMLADAMDQPLHLWDRRGVHQQFVHDPLGRPTDVHVEAHTETLELDHTTEHMVYGDDPAVTDGAVRNARGRLVEHYDQAGLITIRQYAPDGNPLHAERRLVPLTEDDYHTEPDWRDPTSDQLEDPFTTRNAFDALGRVTEQSLPDDTTRAFRYLSSGGVNQVLVSTGDGEWTDTPFLQRCAYDARSQRTEALLGNDNLVKYTYSPDTFRLTNLQTGSAENGTRIYQNIDYTYDPVGNITRQVDQAQQIGNGGHVLRGLGVSPECDYTYDAFYQLRTATGRVHQALLQNDYQPIWNNENRMKGARRISLNDASRVERYTRTYSYDVSGNIEFIHHEGDSRTWNTEIRTSEISNRSLPAQDFNGIDILNIEDDFDPNGNCEYMPHLRQIVWNYRNNISTAVIIDRSEDGRPDDVEYYVYGGDGMRVRKLSRHLIGSSDPNVPDEIEVIEKIYLDGCEIKRIHRDGSLTLDQTTSHITDGAERIALLHQSPSSNNGPTEKKIRYQLSNHLGSSMLEVSEHGEVITYEEYFAYGGTAFIGGDQREVRLKDYRYSGKERDNGTGFYYYGYRYYAAWIGNWLSPDPIGPEDGVNLYTFVQNNPINMVDPDGLSTTVFYNGYPVRLITWEEARQRGATSPDVPWSGVDMPTETRTDRPTNEDAPELPSNATIADIAQLARQHQVPIISYEPRYWALIDEGLSSEQALRQLGAEEIEADEAASEAEVQRVEENRPTEALQNEQAEDSESVNENEPRNPTGTPGDSNDMPEDGNPNVHNAAGSSNTAESKEQRAQELRQMPGYGVAATMAKLHSDISSLPLLSKIAIGQAFRESTDYISENLAAPVLGDTLGPNVVAWYQGQLEVAGETIDRTARGIVTNPINNPSGVLLSIIADQALRSPMRMLEYHQRGEGFLSRVSSEFGHVWDQVFPSRPSIPTLSGALSVLQSLPPVQMGEEIGGAYNAGSRGDVVEAYRRAGRAIARLGETALLLAVAGTRSRSGGSVVRGASWHRNDLLRLQRHVRRATNDIDALGDLAFTTRQLFVIRHVWPRLRAAFRGNRIDVLARRRILNDPTLQHLRSFYTRGPDFLHQLHGYWFDMTTPGQWAAHVVRYGRLRLPNQPSHLPSYSRRGFRLPTESSRFSRKGNIHGSQGFYRKRFD